MPDLSTSLKTGFSAIEEIQGLFTNVGFSIGAEASNAIIVSIQLKNARSGADAAQRRAVLVYLSDDANGDTVVATAPSGAVAAGTDGALIDISGGKKAFLAISEADGDIDISITEAGAKTLYMNVVCGDRLHTSSAITFA